MRAKSLILFVIAVGCGLAASIGVSQYMEKAGSGPSVETAKIFVAMTDLTIGERLDAQKVKLEEWPKDRVPEGAVSELDDLEEKFSATRMYAGEPILAAKLLDSNVSGATQTIPKGYRAVPVKVSAETAGGGLIQPGDRVDVLVMLRKSSDIPQTGTRTILRDVNIFSVDGATERSVDENGRATHLNTVSLLLKPHQAEAVLLASELGRLMLTLRRPDDDIDASSEGETVHSLLGNAGERANESEATNSGEGFANWLNQMSATEPAPQPVQAAPPAPIVEDERPAWKLVIMGPQGSQQYYWMDEDELPQEGSFESRNAVGGNTTPAVPVFTPTSSVGPEAAPISSEDAIAEEESGQVEDDAS